MHRILSRTALAALVAIMARAAMLAQIPRRISYQGVLSDAAGNLVTGAHTLRVSIYDGAAGESPLYDEDFHVDTHNGLFDIIIGTSSELPASLTFDRPYFLGLSVDGGGELAPRTALTSASYALSAANAILTLPYDGLTTYDSVAFSVRNAGNGVAGRFGLTSAESASPVLLVQHAGTGAGVMATTNGNGLWGITSGSSAAAVIGDNTGGGESVVGRTRGHLVGAVVGRNDSDGYGVRGFSTGSGIGVIGQAGVSGSTGVAGRFENINGGNGSTALEAVTNGAGWAATVSSTRAGGDAHGLQVKTAPGAGGVALDVANGTVSLSYQSSYAGDNIDDAALVITTVGERQIPTTHAPDGTHIWVVNNSGGSVTITNTTAGSLAIAPGKMQHFALMKAVSGVNWIPEQ